jgi:hypothetical protein
VLPDPETERGFWERWRPAGERVVVGQQAGGSSMVASAAQPDPALALQLAFERRMAMLSSPDEKNF